MNQSVPVGIGVIGLGHWGPNHVRVFNQRPDARVIVAADPSESRRRHLAGLYRDLELVADADSSSPLARAVTTGGAVLDMF